MATSFLWNHVAFYIDSTKPFPEEVPLPEFPSSLHTLILVSCSEESPYQVDRTFKSILQSIQYAIRYGSIASERIHVCFVWDGFKALDTRLFGGSNAPGDMAARSDNPMFGSTDWDRMMDAQARAAETPSGPEGKQSPVGHFMQAVVKGKINETVQFDFELSVSAFIKSEELGSLDSIAVGLVGLCPRLRPQYMLCIGGSVELEPQSLDRLIGAMERDPNCGLVTGRVQPIVDGTCHMVLPVPAQHIAMGIYNNVVTQASSSCLGMVSEVCEDLFLVRLGSVEEFGAVTPSGHALKAFLAQSGSADLNVTSAAAGKALSCAIVTSPGQCFMSRLEPSAVAHKPAAIDMVDACVMKSGALSVQLYSQLMVMDMLFHGLPHSTHGLLRRCCLLLTLPVEACFLVVKLLGPAHLYIVLFLGIRLLPSSRAWPWLVFRSGMTALFLLAFMVQVFVSFTVRNRRPRPPHDHAPIVLLNGAATVLSGLTILVLVASFQHFDRMSHLAFAVVMAVLGSFGILTLLSGQFSLFVSTVCQWLVMAPTQLLLHETHAMLSDCDVSRLYRNSVWLLSNVGFCFAILGPDVGPQYLRGIVVTVSAAVLLKMCLSCVELCRCAVHTWRRDRSRPLTNSSTSPVPPARLSSPARGFVLSQPVPSSSSSSLPTSFPRGKSSRGSYTGPTAAAPPPPPPLPGEMNQEEDRQPSPVTTTTRKLKKTPSGPVSDDAVRDVFTVAIRDDPQDRK